MILLFHSLYIFCVQFLKHRKNKIFLQQILETKKSIEDEVNRHTTTHLDAELNLRFDPPVYKQRYEAVLKVLLDDRWRKHIHKIVDFGCSEFGLFYLIRTLYNLTEVLEVDVDEQLLQEYLFRLHPRTVDFMNKRPLPLSVKVYVGSVASPDPVLSGIDVVIAVELIEHLYPDVLDAFPYNIFCYIHPKLVIVTTPNADFNVFFSNFNKRRHYDHKFEWTREQFEDWAHNITQRFPDYVASFIGIGSAPNGVTDRGHCSQMALFERQDPNDDLATTITQSCRHVKSVYTVDSENKQTSASDSCGDCVKEPSFGICTYYSYSKQTVDFENDDSCYKLIESIEYPYEDRDPEEIIMYDILYKLSVLGRCSGMYYSEEKNKAEIPLKQLTEWPSDGPLISEGEVREILIRSGYRIEECVINDGEKPVLCVIYEPTMEHSSSPTTDSDYSDIQTNNDYQINEINNLSDWDVETNDTVENTRETVQAQASELLSAVFNDLEANEPELLSQQTQDKPVETKVKFLMTRPMEAGTSRNETKVAKKHKDPLQNTTTKVVTANQSSKEPIAGTSRKRKKLRKSEEDEVVEDVKELTECIVRNSLNKVADQPIVIQAPEVVEVPAEMHAEVVEEVPAVGNGDLANNNRDVEGNNCVAERAAENIENVGENNPPGEIVRNEDYQNKNEEPDNEEKENNDSDDESDDIELSFASREALFDPNSKQDLLDDFEIPPAPASEASEIVMDERPEENAHGPFDVVLLGVNINPNDAAPPEPFPLWLLHLLGADVIDAEHNEPHFYCQGDGLGVHPSVVEVDIETSSSESSSNNSNDDAESEHTALETAETVSLPEDNENATQTNAQTIRTTTTESQSSTKQSDGTDEFFDSKEEGQPSTSKGT